MKIIFLLAFSGIMASVQAQTNPHLTLSLQEAMQLGIKNRSDLKAEQYNVNLVENKTTRSKGAWIPDVHAEGNVQYNAQLQPTYVPKGFAGFTKPELLSFGAKNITAFGLSIDQPVFKPGLNTDVKIAEADLAYQKEKIKGNEINIKNSIATAYFDVLLKKLQFQIAKDEETRFGKYQDLAEGKYKNGALIENDYLRAKLDYENAKIRTTTARQNYGLSLIYLKYQINIPKESDLILADSIGSVFFEPVTMQPKNLMDQRTEIKQLQLQLQENALQEKRTRQNELPSVSVFGYYAQMYQNQNFHYDESKWWAPHSYVGLKFKVPITGRLTNDKNIREYHFRKQQLEMDLQQKKSDVQYQIQKAMIDLQNALHNEKSAKDNYALSQTIYKNQQQQFAIGVFQYSDLLDTEKSLSNAETNYLQTAYNYLVAQLQYEKAIGEL